MNICNTCSGDFAFTKHLFFLYKLFKLVDGECESAFLHFFKDGAHCQTKTTKSQAVHNND